MEYLRAVWSFLPLGCWIGIGLYFFMGFVLMIAEIIWHWRHPGEASPKQTI